MATAAVIILLAALLPALAALTDSQLPAADYSLALTPSHTCGDPWGTYDMGTYAPGSAYQATLRHLAATIPAEANAESCNCSNGNIGGESPNRIVANAYCSWHPDAKSPDCGACIALAFQEAQRLCPYQRMAEAVVDGGACKAYFHDYDIMEHYVHYGPGDLQGNTMDQVVGVVKENEENSMRMRWACRILETTIRDIFANLGWISNGRICA